MGTGACTTKNVLKYLAPIGCFTLAIILTIATFLTILFITPTTVDPLPTFPTTGDAVGDNVFELSIGWNIVSMPDITAKESVYLSYNNIEYTWSEATQVPIIVDELKGYDGTGYYNADTFLPYRGYWIYSFVEPAFIYQNSSTIICNKLMFDNNSTLNLTCDNLIITEFSDVNITCNTMNPAMVGFKYAGIPMP